MTQLWPAGQTRPTKYFIHPWLPGQTSSGVPLWAAADCAGARSPGGTDQRQSDGRASVGLASPPPRLLSRRTRHKNQLAHGHRPARTAGSRRREGSAAVGLPDRVPSCLCRTLRPPKMTLQWAFESPGKDSRAPGTSSCLLAAAHSLAVCRGHSPRTAGSTVVESGVARGHSCILLRSTVGKTPIPLSYASSLFVGSAPPGPQNLKPWGASPETRQRNRDDAGLSNAALL